MISMHKIVNFCFDRLSDPELGYPNLAVANLGPDEFDVTWPRALPVRLFAYFTVADMHHRNWLVEHAPVGSWYPIGLAWHDFDCDYFDLLPPLTHDRVKSGEIKLLFYYHEGDNPQRIKTRFDHLCDKHGFPRNSYLFLIANSAGDQLENFMYFPDHELFFRYVNRYQRPDFQISLDRKYTFTVLNRTHKWWRASCMADLHRNSALENSLWSYDHTVDIGDQYHDNPICVDDIPGLHKSLNDFLAGSPYSCDNADKKQQNDHRQVNASLYTQSYCHVILETHFDADQSGGTFLTEKTYKCLKYSQPFIIVGPPHSLQALRDRGYRVFDHAIDNSYDSIVDNTKRWKAVKQSILDIKSKISREWFEGCLEDLRWNQQKFLGGSTELMELLVDRLYQLSTDK
jgi:hypothetical protein